MRDWYCEVLEAHVVHENDAIVFATYDDEHHRVAFIANGATEQPSATAAGVDHIAFAYDSMGELFDNYERLKAIDVTPYRTINHGPTTSMYYRDPDGNQVEFQTDNFDTLEETVAYFESSEFAENPIGVNFDPEALIERFRRGEPRSELIKRGSA